MMFGIVDGLSILDVPFGVLYSVRFSSAMNYCTSRSSMTEMGSIPNRGSRYLSDLMTFRYRSVDLIAPSKENSLSANRLRLGRPIQARALKLRVATVAPTGVALLSTA